MIENRIWLLLSLEMSGEATPEELEELEALLKMEPGISQKADLLRKLKPIGFPVNNADITNAFEKHMRKLKSEPGPNDVKPGDEEKEYPFMQPQKRSLKYRWILAGVGIAASLIGIFFFFYPHKQLTSEKIYENTVSTPVSSKSKVQLPDGSQVWLNASSRLDYSKDFSGKYREVKLTGEAYFDVAKDKTRPFIIHTQALDITVIGTAFNVRAYADEKTTETSLIRGSIEITLHDNPGKKIVLKPNDKVVISNIQSTRADTANTDTEHKFAAKTKTAPVITLENVHLDKNEQDVIETMWVYNKLAFDNEPLEKIATALQRWYNVEITVINEELKEKHFTGIFENKTLPEVLDALQASKYLDYEIRENKVKIW